LPTYDYECKSCHHRFEVRQGFHDDRVAYCPLCSKSAERKISLVPVIFKGSGWYVTDYAKKSSTSNVQTKETDKDSKSSDKNAAKESTKSEKTGSKTPDSKKDTTTSKNKSDS
tara:strand:- start:165 stop:503 length:339 start_codon:yes stop_codon:yes gene_type:complete